jgi:hypothetical protein
MRLKSAWLLLPLLLPFSGAANASSQCAATLSELKTMMGGQVFPLNWQETSMDDGKPLLVNITESKGALNIAFSKTSEGLWAESDGIICKTATGLGNPLQWRPDSCRASGQLGAALRLEKGGKFTLTQLGSDQLRIATSGWSGTFTARLR